MLLLVRTLVDLFPYHVIHRKGDTFQMLLKDVNAEIRKGNVEIVIDTHGNNAVIPEKPTDADSGYYPWVDACFGTKPPAVYTPPVTQYNSYVGQHPLYDMVDPDELETMRRDFANTGYFKIAGGAAEEKYLQAILPGYVFLSNIKDLVGDDSDYDYCYGLIQHNNTIYSMGDGSNGWTSYSALTPGNPWSDKLLNAVRESNLYTGLIDTDR